MQRYLVTFLMLATLESMSQAIPNQTKSFALRLTPRQDVKKTLLSFTKENHIKEGCILSAVGSVEQLNLWYANPEAGIKLKGYFEVVSLTGTFSSGSAHLHMSVADSTGRTLGGHLLDDNNVYTTLEAIVGDLTDVQFDREKDPTYGHPELVIKPRTKNKE